MSACVRSALIVLAIWWPSSWALGAASVVVNGDFESPAVVDRYLTIGTRSSFLGWTVVSGGIDLTASSFYAAASGVQSVDLNSVVNGAIAQVVATTPGRAYSLTFALATNPLPDHPAFPSPAVKQLQVSWNSSVVATLFPSSIGRTGTNVGWQEMTVPVVAAGADRLVFASLTGGSAGPAIDNVRLVEIPEPSGVVLTAIALWSAAVARRRSAPRRRSPP